MNRKISFHELAAILAENCNISPAEAEDFIKGFFDFTTQKLSESEPVDIKGIGKFYLSGDKDNPVAFVPDGELADAINAPFAMFEPEEVSDTLSDAAIAQLDNFIEDTTASEVSNNTAQQKESVNETVVASVIDTHIDSVEETETEVVEKVDTDTVKETVTEYVKESEPEAVDDSTPKVPVEDDSVSPVAEPSPLNESKSEVQSPVSQSVKAKVEKIYSEPSFPEEEPEEYYHEPQQQKSGPGFGWGFFFGILIGLALGACAVYFAIDYIFPTIPDEYRNLLDNEEQLDESISTLTVLEDALPIADTTTVDSVPETKSVPETISAKPQQTQAPAQTPAETPKPIVKDTVKKGYLLHDMAKKHYGNKCFWVYIYEENKAKISNPNRVNAGMQLVIPDAAKYGIDSKNPASVKAANDKAAQILSKFSK